MTTIEDLLDKAEIASQMANYCRAVDRMDRDLLLSVFHPDATMEYTDRFPNGTVSEFVDFVWKFHGTLISHSHQITNSIIRLWGDKAGSEFYVSAGLWFIDPEDGKTKEFFIRARYLDRWLRSGETWLITKRFIATDLRELREVSPMETNGRRDRQDRSYEFLDGPV